MTRHLTKPSARGGSGALRTVVLLGVVMLGGCRAKDDPPPTLALQSVQEVTLPGGPARFGGQAVDTTGRRLYVANPGRSRIDVFDLDTLTAAGSVEDLPEVRAVRLAPDLGKLFATVTGRDELVAVDVGTREVVARTATGRFPDGLAYDPERHLVTASNRKDGTLTVVDARSGAVVRTVAIEKGVSDVVYEPVSRTMLVAARPPTRLVTFDPATGSIAHRIKLPGCHNAEGVAAEPSGRWAFVTCAGNAKLAVVDLKQHRQRGLREVGEAPHVLAFDAGLQYLYVAGEGGILCVFELGDGDSLRRIGEGMVAPSAHTVAVDPGDHRVFFPLRAVDGHPVLRVLRP